MLEVLGPVTQMDLRRHFLYATVFVETLLLLLATYTHGFRDWLLRHACIALSGGVVKTLPCLLVAKPAMQATKAKDGDAKLSEFAQRSSATADRDAARSAVVFNEVEFEELINYKENCLHDSINNKTISIVNRLLI